MSETAEYEELRKKALKLRGKKSMGLIARELDVTRNVVAGMFFRNSHPGEKKTGAGRGGRGSRAKECIRIGGKPGRVARRSIRIALGQIVALCKDKHTVDLRQSVLEIAESAIAYADKQRDHMRAVSTRRQQATSS